MLWQRICWLLVLSVLHVLASDIVSVNVNHGNIIQTSINSSAEPCEDFYSYACGNYFEQHTATAYQEITGYLESQYNLKILNLIDSLYQSDALQQVSSPCQTFIEKARIYLKACRAETKRNVTKYFEDLKPAPQLEWPILEKLKSPTDGKSFQWSGEHNFNVWSLVGKLQSYGLTNVLINQEILVDKTGEISISLEPPYMDTHTVLADKNVLMVLLMRLGIKKPIKIITDLVKLEEKLLNDLQHYNTVKEDEILEMTYGDLEIHYPQLSLYLTNLLDRELTAQSFIVLKNPSYFQHVNSLDKQKLCNYLMLKFLYYLAIDSTTEFNSMSCVKDLRNKFDLAVNFLYYEHIYKAQSAAIQADLGDMLKNLKFMFAKIFEENHLQLTKSQVQQLLFKLAQVKLNIGNLPHQVDFKKVQDFYTELPLLDKNNYYKNHLIMLKHRFTKSINHPQAQSYFIVNDNNLGSSTGAFYVVKQNMIILPFGSLLKPLYDVRYHDLYKYSLLGFILAHELTHAFDTYNLNLDSEGEVAQPGFAAIRTNGNFQNSLNCLQSQLTTDAIDERIADIVAEQVVYRLYASKHNDLQPHFLASNWNKYFYLNMAQFFCGKENIKFVDHDSDAMRLHQIVKNSEIFAKAFACPANSKFNPSSRCRLY